MENTVNVYRFSAPGKEPIIVVAPDVSTASECVHFDWENIKCVYKNVIVAK